MRLLINRDEVLCPGMAGSTAVLKFLHESLASASIRRRHQHTPDHRAEVVIQEPGVLKAEASATWDFCAGSEEEWNMIRAKASQGGEESVGKDIIPFHVDKASVQPHESGLLTLITPGVSSVRQRDLDETKRVDEVVETICFRSVEVVIVLVHRSASEVEVTHNDPWSTNVSGNGSKFREEALLIFVAGRGINVGKSEFGRVLGKAEAGGERVLFASRGGHCAERLSSQAVRILPDAPMGSRVTQLRSRLGRKEVGRSADRDWSLVSWSAAMTGRAEISSASTSS